MYSSSSTIPPYLGQHSGVEPLSNNDKPSNGHDTPKAIAEQLERVVAVDGARFRKCSAVCTFSWLSRRAGRGGRAAPRWRGVVDIVLVKSVYVLTRPYYYQRVKNAKINA